MLVWLYWRGTGDASRAPLAAEYSTGGFGGLSGGSRESQERAKRDSRRGSQRAREEKRRQDAGVLVVVVVIAAWGTAEILRFAQDDKQLKMVRGVRMGSVESVRAAESKNG